MVDNSRIYHSDANYNFTDLIEFAEIQVGGSLESYQLNSQGRIYTDKDGPIKNIVSMQLDEKVYRRPIEIYRFNAL
jgi:hypothetical protein